MTNRERERERSNSKTFILQDSRVRFIWTYLTASPCHIMVERERERHTHTHTHTHTETDRDRDRQRRRQSNRERFKVGQSDANQRIGCQSVAHILSFE